MRDSAHASVLDTILFLTTMRAVAVLLIATSAVALGQLESDFVDMMPRRPMPMPFPIDGPVPRPRPEPGFPFPIDRPEPRPWIPGPE